MDLGNIATLTTLLLILYAIALGMFYIFYRHSGYPTAYTLNNEGLRVQFHKKVLAYIPYHIIETVTIDQQGPNLNKALIGLGSFRDYTAKKSEKYILIETSFCTYYLTPSNPEKFKLELDNHYTKNTNPTNKQITPETYTRQGSSYASFSGSLKNLFLLLFVKFPVGQMLLGISIMLVLSFLGYPVLAYPLIVISIISLSLTIYCLSSNIGSQLLGSHPTDSAKIQSAIDSLKNKLTTPLPKIEIADPLIKGINAFAVGSSPTRSRVILTKGMENLAQAEIEAIIVHELGHIRHWHSLKLTLLGIFVNVFLFVVVFTLNVTAVVLIFIFVFFLIMSVFSKFFEMNADCFATHIVEPEAFSSALRKVGESAVYRLYEQFLTTGKAKSLDELREALGIIAPKSSIRKSYLWIFSSHPPLYYRLKILQDTI
ncbi:MAG: M48 family metalloprotease [Nitrososphaerota archaeon]|jgi:heat shock protein HtpX|nr:M48 family metalloprotease [Nitrososphaerota archaeon]